MKSLVEQLKRNWKLALIIGALILMAAEGRIVADQGAPSRSGAWIVANYPANISGTYGEVAVSNVAATAVPTTPLAYRRALNIQNNSQNAIYCGFSNAVTVTTGHKVASGGGVWALEIGPNIQLWCISLTAAQTAGGTPTVATSYAEVR
jgi:hypothetical protein